MSSTPLSRSHTHICDTIMAPTDHPHSPKQPSMKQIVEEAKQLKEIFIPLTTMHLITYLRSMTSVLCMGKLGSLELAGGALAIGFTNITGYSLLSGLTLGMEPICSQAFGSQNLNLVHLTLRRTILLLLFTSLPVSLLWLNLQPILVFFRQDPSITKMASLYSVFALPDLIINSFLHPLRIYLRCRGNTAPLMWSTTIAVIFHVPLTFLLAFVLKLGIPGIAIASCCTNLNTLIFLLMYMLYTGSCPPTGCKQDLISKGDNNGHWITLLRLALPSCVGVCLEWWWYEFMTLSAGYLPDPHVTVAVAAIVIQTTSLLYAFPVALSASVSTRVGTELGSRKPSQAHLAALVAMVLAFGISLVGLVWTIVGRRLWGQAFSTDEEILKLTMQVLPVIGLCELGNCPQTTGCGVLRGSARPNTGARINLISFYLVGSPIALIMAFTFQFGFLGLCYGLLGAQIAAALMAFTVIWNTNWEEEALKAKLLVGTDACENRDDTSKADTDFSKEDHTEV
ncbi:protein DETOXIFICATION 55 isoform X2 [Nymphaea colorata]|nr:protein DETOXIFICATION 55 isoform X2 [Nymphaea colorata]